MRFWPLLAVLAVMGNSGCTHQALARRTVYQGSTLTDLQYHQVLDNIAMFACNPDALPWHLKLNSGSVQVSDQGTGLFSDVFTADKPTIYTMTFSAQRGVVNQWAVIPTVDPENLAALELAYQKAIDPLDTEGRLRQAIFARIGEIAVNFNIVLTSDTLDKVIDSAGQLDDVARWNLKRKNAEFHKRLEQAFDHVARLSQPISDDQIDNYARRLYGKITEETRGEARVKAQQQQERDRVSISQSRIGVEDELVRLTRAACNLPYVPRYPATGRAERAPYSIEQAEKQIRTLQALAESPEFARPWIIFAKCRSDLPPCLSYVGTWCKNGCHCYVGVAPENLGVLRNFTLAILTLAPITAQESGSAIGGNSITYSPTIGGGVR